MTTVEVCDTGNKNKVWERAYTRRKVSRLKTCASPWVMKL